MGFGSQFKGGGKKGPRQVSSKKQHKIQLRPAPAKEIQPLPQYPVDEEEDGAADEELDEHQYGYRASLVPERRPLVGLKVSVSGCGGNKEDLLALAEEYGAERHGGLQEDTTHVVTDRPVGAKYQVALSRRMHVIKPSWLPAVRDAWCSGEEIDWVRLEDDHKMPPLFGAVVCLTHFARGDYKDRFKAFLVSAGATLSEKLDTLTTHLIVASPTSPHSQTPSSEKLLHARRNRNRLHPEFSVIWEGWAREAVKYGGRRAERDKDWEWREKRMGRAVDGSAGQVHRRRSRWRAPPSATGVEASLENAASPSATACKSDGRGSAKYFRFFSPPRPSFEPLPPVRPTSGRLFPLPLHAAAFQRSQPFDNSLGCYLCLFFHEQLSAGSTPASSPVR